MGPDDPASGPTFTRQAAVRAAPSKPAEHRDKSVRRHLLDMKAHHDVGTVMQRPVMNAAASWLVDLAQGEHDQRPIMRTRYGAQSISTSPAVFTAE